METIRVTVDGIAVDVKRDTFSDFKTLGLFSKARKGDIVAIYDFTEAVFGSDQLEAILAKLPSTQLDVVFGFVNKCIEAAAKSQGEDAKN